MDFAKFASFIGRKALFFCPASFFADPFEGSFPNGNLKLRAARDFVVTNEAEFNRGMKSELFFNCWNMGTYESEALWKLYGGEGKAIAIISTYKRLMDALSAQCIIGAINYIDYTSDAVIPEGTVYAPFFYKRKSLEHEQELRAMIPAAKTKYREEFGGVYVPVDIEKLVTEVRVSPTSPEWYMETVKALIRVSGLQLEVHQSTIDADPIF